MTGPEIVTVSGPGAPSIVVDLLVRPDADSVLIVPGFWRVRRDPLMLGIAETLHDAKLTVATMDNRGHGASGGTFGFNTHESDDVIRVLESLRRRIGSDESFCIVGFSAGGAIAISVAARRPDLVRGLILVSPVAEFKRVLPRPNPFRFRHQVSMRAAIRPPRFWWYEKTRRHALADAKSVTAPVMLLHARNDWLVRHDHSQWIAERLPSPPEMHVIDFDRTHAERLLASAGRPWDLLFDFMRNSLGMRCQAGESRNAEKSR